jgi:phenylalanyl-tRNA synthetase beta chain
MKISYNWLKNIFDFEIDSKRTEELLTDIGLEVEKSEKYESIKGGLNGLIIGEILKVEKHPNADKLNVTLVDVGEESHYTIVCGAPNVNVNQKVIVALPGTTIYPTNGEPFKIKKAKIRGIESSGMICAEDEIGVGNDHDGIIIVPTENKAGKKASEYFKVSSDTIFEIGLTPNRADAMSHYGVARDLLAVLNYKEQNSKKSKLIELTKKEQLVFKNDSKIKIEIEDPENCYQYSGVIIKNITVTKSPKWLKTRLESIGLKPINNIVDITNFILHDLGQPLHAFDLSSISNNTIKVRNAKKNTSFITLDGNERKLNENDLMICNSNKEMCIAGVFGGLDSGVQNSTKDIFLESALFNPVSIRKTAKRHGLNTDASFRYERGVDPNMVIPALVKAAQMIVDVSGGEISSEIFNVHPTKIIDKSFKINFASIRKLCGISLDNSSMAKILGFLDIKVSDLNSAETQVTVPSYRNDVTREADIAEEILRIYGYNEVVIPNKINSSPTFTNVKNKVGLQQLVSNHLSSLGYFEILSNSLSKKSYLDYLESTQNESENQIHLLNPLSSDTEVLRQSLVYNALEVIKYNQQNGEPNCKIYEWGKTYQQSNDKFKEEEHLVIGLSGLQNDEHWYNGKEPTSFYQLKGIVESIFDVLGVYYDDSILGEFKIWDDGLIYKNNNLPLARIGLANNKLSAKMDLKENCFIAEIYWGYLSKAALKKKVRFKPVNKFQKVYRDLSIMIDESVPMEDILNSVKKVKTPLLKSVSLFDIYRDTKNMEDKKSYGLRFQFLHTDRTLKDKEVDKIMQSIQKNISESVNASFR